MAKHYGPKYEKKHRKMKLLERDVLRYLKDHSGCADYNVVYVYFDPNRTGDIGPAIQDLLQWNLAKRTTDGKLELTDYGSQTPDNPDYWK